MSQIQIQVFVHNDTEQVVWKCCVYYCQVSVEQESAHKFSEQFVGMFAELQKVTVSIVISVHSFVHMEKLSSLWTNCRYI
jgi:hypothetical protein